MGIYANSYRVSHYRGVNLMDREKFQGLSISQKVEFVNQKLKQGQSLTQVSEYTISRKTISNQFKKGDYVFDKKRKQYVKTELEVKEAESRKLDDNFDFIQENKSKLMDLVKNYDKIIEIVKNDNVYSKCHDDKKLIIELPKTTEEDARTTLRINPIVYKQFEKFLKLNKQVTKKELVSQALKEFVEKYKDYETYNKQEI